MKKGIFLILLISLIISACGSGKDNDSKSNTKLSYNPGDIVILPYMFLGTTKEHNSQLVDYSVVKNSAGIEKMIMEGKAFVVAENTKGKVIGSSFLTLQVEILDGKYQGQTGWISAELVTK